MAIGSINYCVATTNAMSSVITTRTFLEQSMQIRMADCVESMIGNCTPDKFIDIVRNPDVEPRDTWLFFNTTDEMNTAVRWCLRSTSDLAFREIRP